MDLVDRCFLGDDAFGHGAVADSAEYAVAGFESGDAFADLGDNTADLGAGDEGEGRLELVLAYDLKGVRKVESGGVDIDQDSTLRTPSL